MNPNSIVGRNALATAFLAAAETDDLDLVKAHFTDRDTQAELAVWNTVQRARRLGDRSHPVDSIRSWYLRTGDSEFKLIKSIVNGGRVEILQWFFAREQLALLGDNMLHEMAKELLRMSMTPTATFEIAENVLESPLFTDMMDDKERRHVLGAALQVATSMGLTRWCDVLLAYRADPTFAPDYPTLLNEIVDDGNSATLDLLVEHGTWIVGERLPLPHGHDDSKGLVCDMVRRGADAHTVSMTHGSVLHHAARHGYREIVESLLVDGFADVDARDAVGRTPLVVVGKCLRPVLGASLPHRVAQLRMVTQLLLDADADTHAVDAKQRGVRHHVVRNV